jgi:arylformamidase
MILDTVIGGRAVAVDLSHPIDCALPLDFEAEQPQVFGLAAATRTPVRAGTFVGDTRRGGSCNCETITLNPHGNGTHTEGYGHISEARLSVMSTPPPPLLDAWVLSITPEPLATSGESYGGQSSPTDNVLTAAALRRGLQNVEQVGALIVRTAAHDPERRRRNYDANPAPYPTADAMRFLRERGVQHLLLDTPSADRQEDGGRLTNHRIFWADGDHGGRTITELIDVPDIVDDGPHLLNLQMPPLHLDAVPSRPLLFAPTLRNDS